MMARAVPWSHASVLTHLLRHEDAEGGAVNVTAGSLTLTAALPQNSVAQGGVGGNDGEADTFALPGIGVRGNGYGGALGSKQAKVSAFETRIHEKNSKSFGISGV